MQLLAIILYSRWGDRRVLRFRPGTLNVITGQSGTGKSALLDIVEFCLGRETVPMSIGPITSTVSWYAVLVQLPGGLRAFAARPAARRGAATTQQGMLEIGASLEPLDYSALKVNAEAHGIRAELSSIIGIQETRTATRPGSLQRGFQPNLSHALFLCLQGQNEIANRDLVFHRQGEERITSAIQDTLPYFLGAVTPEQVQKRQMLQAAQRDLRRTEGQLESARQASEQLDVRIRSVVAEAYASGVITQASFSDRSSAMAALRAGVLGEVASPPLDDGLVARLRGLEARRASLREELRETSELRNMLEMQSREQDSYAAAVTAQSDRLSSLEVLPEGEAEDSDACPVCGSLLAQPDPTPSQLREAVLEVETQLRELTGANPRLRDAIQEVDERLATLRDELRALELAATNLSASASPNVESRAEERAFSRGRLDALLESFRPVDAAELQGWRDAASSLSATVERLESELDPDAEREQISSRLLTIASDMTDWVERLQLEHAGRTVRLTLYPLTVVADTESGPIPMSRIGSAENWVGFHLVTHLALQRYFVRQERPVPRFLMLDQPTQAYYPSEVEQTGGVPSRDQDRGRSAGYTNSYCRSFKSWHLNCK